METDPSKPASSPPPSSEQDFWDLDKAPPSAPSPRSSKNVAENDFQAQPPGPSSEPTAAPINRSKISKREKFAIIASFVLLLAGGVWATSVLLAPRAWASEEESKVVFPVAGQSITLQSLETWWREPVLTGPDRDLGVDPSIELIPELRLTLTGSGGGALRLIFSNAEGRRVGDPITLQIRDGKFQKTGSNVISVSSTQGLQDKNLRFVMLQKESPSWSIVILESGGARSDDFTQLLSYELSSAKR